MHEYSSHNNSNVLNAFHKSRDDVRLNGSVQRVNRFEQS